MPQWTQDEAIAFECACEVITHMIAIQSRQIYEETNKGEPDVFRVAELRAERSRLAQERLALHVDNHDGVARVCSEYGAIIRARREKRHDRYFSP